MATNMLKLISMSVCLTFKEIITPPPSLFPPKFCPQMRFYYHRYSLCLAGYTLYNYLYFIYVKSKFFSPLGPTFDPLRAIPSPLSVPSLQIVEI